jgi:hypothetical protein
MVKNDRINYSVNLVKSNNQNKTIFSPRPVGSDIKKQPYICPIQRAEPKRKHPSKKL